MTNTVAALLQLQHLWLYIFFLTYEEEELRPWRSPVNFKGLQYRLVRYEAAIERIAYARYEYYDSFLDLTVNRIDHSSPLNVHTTTPLPVPQALSRFRKVLKIVQQLLIIDEIREKAHWETEIARQRAIEAALKNTEKTLDLSKKIKNPEEREEFIRSMAKAIGTLRRDGQLNLRRIEVAELPDDDASVG